MSLVAHLFGAAVALAACSESSTQVLAPGLTANDSVSTSEKWNQRAVALIIARQPASNGQAAVSRILTYLSLAQYRAVAAAQLSADMPKPPSVTAAVAGASAMVLKSFFPLDSAATDAQLKADLATPPSPSTSHEDVASGAALGRGVASAVIAQAESDNYLVATVSAPPVGPDKWVSSSAAIVRSLRCSRRRGCSLACHSHGGSGRCSRSRSTCFDNLCCHPDEHSGEGSSPVRSHNGLARGSCDAQ